MMGKMRSLLPASARSPTAMDGSCGALDSPQGVSTSVTTQRRDPGEESSDNGGENASNDRKQQGRRKLLWTDDLLDAMLRMRFTDPTIADAIDRAFSNEQKAAAWRQFAAALSLLSNKRVSERQLRLKFAKLKWEHKRWSEAGLEEEDRRALGRPPSYLPVLRRWFGSQHDREPASTPTVEPEQAVEDANSVKTALQTPTRQEEADTERLQGQPSAEVSEQRGSARSQDVAGPGVEPSLPGGVALLAQEAGRGLAAIADAIKTRPTGDQAAVVEQTRHAEQMAVLQALLDGQRAQNELLERIAASLANK